MIRLFCALIFALSFQPAVLIQTKDVIIWEPSRKLRWTDFQGYPDSTSDASAGTHMNIRLEYRLKNHLVYSKVECVFFKKKSWTKVSSYEALSHEQVHFDIGEIFARMIRKNLRDNRLTYNRDSKRDIDSMFRSYFESYMLMQKMYDSATSNGQRIYAQQKWAINVQSQLDSLNKYCR